MSIKTYSELITFTTFEERFNYLMLSGTVGKDTFGFDRYLNQVFYKSAEWRRLRNHLIVRDNGCDLGVDGYDIRDRIIIHHINPLQKEDIVERTAYLMNPEFLICTTLNTHNAIHYGDDSLIFTKLNERSKNDMCPWRHE